MNTPAPCWPRLRNWKPLLTECQHRLVLVGDGIIPKRCSFEPQEESLGRQSAAISAQRLAASQHPMARDDDRDRIAMVGLPDRAKGVSAPHQPGNLRIAPRLAVWNAQQLFPTVSLEIGTTKVELYRELAPLAAEVLGQLLPYRSARF